MSIDEYKELADFVLNGIAWRYALLPLLVVMFRRPERVGK